MTNAGRRPLPAIFDMTIDATVQSGFAAILAAMPSISVTVRFAGDGIDLVGQVEGALCTGLDRIRVTADDGMIDSADGVIRYQQSSEPASWGIQAGNEFPAINGQVVEILFADSEQWRKARVIARKTVAGMVRLNVEAVYP